MADGGLVGAARSFFSPHKKAERLGEGSFKGLLPPMSELDAALSARQGLNPSPAWANEVTQNAIDEVRAPAFPQNIIELLLGDTPSAGVLSAATVSPRNAFHPNPAKWGIEKMPQGARGFIPAPMLGALSMLLRSGEAAAPTGRDEYESHGRWQPFTKFKE